MKYKITEVVKEILENEPKTRNSDYWLWLEVIKFELNEKGAGALLKTWNLEDFLSRGFNFVSHFETVSRARRKIQAKYPDLRGEERVQEVRAELEEGYRAYARNERV